MFSVLDEKSISFLMFQQFKNIFPNASLNISSITSSIGIERTGLHRLEAIKSEISNINSLIHNRPEPNDGIDLQQSGRTSITELEATRQTMQKLEEGWETIHQNNLINYRKQKAVNELLRRLQHTGELHYTVCQQLEHSEADLREIQTSIGQIQNTALNLINTLAALEQQIDQANREHQIKEFEQWKENEEKELMNEIAARRALLVEKENKLKKEYEEYESIQKKKKLELYEATFNAELEDYKRRRETEISSLYNRRNMTSVQTSLEQLQLVDENKGDLDDFLGTSEANKAIETTTTSDIKELKDDLSSSDDERADILRDEDYDDV
ncbi:hypothetical protein AB4K20DRAFT_1882426 [Rhizopus microsporus]